jgi:replicative DNA helicase
MQTLQIKDSSIHDKNMKTIGSIIKEFSDSFNIITTGFRQIDTRKRGWHPGELCIIGGRPRMGKSAFILSVIKNILKEDFPIALFTATDTIHIQFLSRIVSHLTNKNLTISTAKNLKLLQEYLPIRSTKELLVSKLALLNQLQGLIMEQEKK